MKDPKWIAKEVTSKGTSIYVWNPLGQKAVAYLKFHLFNGEQKIGDAYHCADGHEYIKVGDQTYNHDLKSDTWVNSTHTA